jgi:hypothetical protein
MTKISFPRPILLLAAIALMSLAPMRARAAFTSYFDPLLQELQSRSATLTNKADKLQRKQKKAADMCIRIINKNTNSLRGDITAAGAVSRLLTKNFSGEFSATVKGLTVVTNLETLLEGAFTSLQSDVVGTIDDLTALINGLADGKAKTRALSQFTAATNKLATIQNDTDFSTWSKLLASGLKSALSGINIAAKAGGGSTGSPKFTATVSIGGTNINFVADSFGAEWVQTSGILDIGGMRTGVGNFSVPIVSGFTGATGTYPLGGAGSYQPAGTFTFYILQSGTLNITSFNAANHSLSAMFSFTATNDAGGLVTVNNGMVSVNNLTVVP